MNQKKIHYIVWTIAGIFVFLSIYTDYKYLGILAFITVLIDCVIEVYFEIKKERKNIALLCLSIVSKIFITIFTLYMIK